MSGTERQQQKGIWAKESISKQPREAHLAGVGSPTSDRFSDILRLGSASDMWLDYPENKRDSAFLKYARDDFGANQEADAPLDEDSLHAAKFEDDASTERGVDYFHAQRGSADTLHGDMRGEGLSSVQERMVRWFPDMRGLLTRAAFLGDDTYSLRADVSLFMCVLRACGRAGAGECVRVCFYVCVFVYPRACVRVGAHSFMFVLITLCAYERANLSSCSCFFVREGATFDVCVHVRFWSLSALSVYAHGSVCTILGRISMP